MTPDPAWRSPTQPNKSQRGPPPPHSQVGIPPILAPSRAAGGPLYYFVTLSSAPRNSAELTNRSQVGGEGLGSR